MHVAIHLKQHSSLARDTALHMDRHLAVSAELNRIVSVRSPKVTLDGHYPLPFQLTLGCVRTFLTVLLQRDHSVQPTHSNTRTVSRNYSTGVSETSGEVSGGVVSSPIGSLGSVGITSSEDSEPSGTGVSEITTGSTRGVVIDAPCCWSRS